VAEGARVVYTIFPDTSAQKKFERAETWPELVQRIKSPTSSFWTGPLVGTLKKVG
jgi:hypothetical protein